MNHKYDIYYLVGGLLLPAVVNVLRLVFNVKMPDWLAISLMGLGIAALVIYAVRYWKGRQES